MSKLLNIVEVRNYMIDAGSGPGGRFAPFFHSFFWCTNFACAFFNPIVVTNFRIVLKPGRNGQSRLIN